MKSSEPSKNRFGAGLEEMARYWEADSALLLEDLRLAFRLGDWHRLLHSAHRMAGGAGVMGAAEVVERARALENFARRKSPLPARPGPEVSRLLSLLEEARERFLADLFSETLA